MLTDVIEIFWLKQRLQETPRIVPCSSNTKQAAFAVAASGAFWVERGLEAINEAT